jgi:hypothetical protein
LTICVKIIVTNQYNQISDYLLQMINQINLFNQTDNPTQTSNKFHRISKPQYGLFNAPGQVIANTYISALLYIYSYSQFAQIIEIYITVIIFYTSQNEY